jgi:hypothetical protein
MLPGLHSAAATAQAYSSMHFDDDDQHAYVDDIVSAHPDPTEQLLLDWLVRTVDKLIELHVTVNATKSKLFHAELVSTLLNNVKSTGRKAT